MAIPSQARKHFREGVETRRAAPKPHVRNGEGIVQTTNPPLAGRRKPRWYENPQARKGCEGSSPSARTRICYRAGQDGTILAYCYRRTGAAPAPFSPALERVLHTNVCSALCGPSKRAAKSISCQNRHLNNRHALDRIGHRQTEWNIQNNRDKPRPLWHRWCLSWRAHADKASIGLRFARDAHKPENKYLARMIQDIGVRVLAIVAFNTHP